MDGSMAGTSGDHTGGTGGSGSEDKGKQPWWNFLNVGVAGGDAAASSAAPLAAASASASVPGVAMTSVAAAGEMPAASSGSGGSGGSGHVGPVARCAPSDAELVSVLESVRLGHLVQRGGLDDEARTHGHSRPCPAMLVQAARSRALESRK